MLYSQAFAIPSSGIQRIGTIGGSAVTKHPTKNLEFQVGYEIAPRLGILNIVGTSDDDPNIRNCIANVSGYYNNAITGCAVPSRIRVELPCSVDIVGPAGTGILVEAWEVFAQPTRGGRSSRVVSGGVPLIGAVPSWADSFDAAIGVAGTLSFLDSSAVLLGIVTGNVAGFSIPSATQTFNLTAPNGSFIVFRQGY